jgi:molybdate transport system substrate-binding protein
MKRLPVLLVIAAALAGFIALVWPHPKDDPARKPLVCFVGGTMTPVFNALAAEYRQATGRQVEISSADSGELLASIEMQLQGDLYVAHDPFMDLAMRRGLGVSAWRLGELVPVLIVQKGNPKNIRTVRDLLRPDVRVYLTDYQHSTLGYILPVIFRRAGVDFEELNRTKQIPTHRSGSWVANQLVMQAADAAIVWQVVARLRSKELDEIPLGAEAMPQPGVDAVTSATGKQYSAMPVKVGIVTLACSKHPNEAAEFVKFVCSDAGRRVFREKQFDVGEAYGRVVYLNGVLQPGADR